MKLFLLLVGAFFHVVIISAQNVGIGKTNPVFRLDVLDTVNSVVASFNGGNGMYIPFAEKGVYRGYFGSYAGNPEDVDFGVFGGNNGRLHLTTGNNVPRLTILPTGNVGIGTTNPLQLLSVAKGLLIDQDDDNVGNINTNVLSFGSNSGSAIGARYLVSPKRNRSLDFYTDSTKRLSIFGDGSVVIDPLGKDSGQQFHPGLFFEDQGTGIRSIRRSLGGDPMGYAMLFMLGGDPKIIFTTGGKVGIQTTNPQADLDVNGDMKTESIQINNGTVISTVQSGTFTAGSSGGSQLVTTITFPVPFTVAPKVFATARNANSTNFGDAFSVSVRSVSNTSVTLNIQRTDAAAGWSQQLLIDWLAMRTF